MSLGELQTPMIADLKTSGVAQGVAEAIAKRIVERDESFIDDSTTELEIAERFSISRTTSREAVKILIAKGLISSRQRAGISILPFSSWNLFDPDVLRWITSARPKTEFLHDFSEFRLSIEPQAAYMSALNRSNEHLKDIEQSVNEILNAENCGTHAIEHDVKFHLGILKANNNVFFNYIANILEPAYRTCVASNITVNRDNRGRAMAADHLELFKLIKNREAEGARDAMAKMMKNDLIYLKKRLEKNL